MNVFYNDTHSILQTITTIATVCIAIAAFIVSFFQFRSLKAHNKRSVKPLLSYERHFKRCEEGFGIYIRNNGIGPAIIKEMKIYVDGNEMYDPENKPWRKALDLLYSKYNIDLTVIQPGYFTGNASISVGEKKVLLTLDKNCNTNQEEYFRVALYNINIIIQYESLYAEQFEAKLID